MADLPFLIFDADNHYYEAEDAFTRHLDPKMRRRCMDWAVVKGRKELLVAGAINRFIPNPTFDPVARPGCLDQYYRGNNPKGHTIREAFGELEPIRREYRDRDARLEVMTKQRIEKALYFPTLGVGMEEALKRDTEAVHCAFEAFNRWLLEDWGFAYQERIYAAPYISIMDRDRGIRELEWALENDARFVVMRPSFVYNAGGSRSPADPYFDPFWKLVNDSGVVVVYHGGDSGYGEYSQDWGEGGTTESFKASPFRSITMPREAAVRPVRGADLAPAVPALPEPADREHRDGLVLGAVAVPVDGAHLRPGAELLRRGSVRDVPAPRLDRAVPRGRHRASCATSSAPRTWWRARTGRTRRASPIRPTTRTTSRISPTRRSGS